MVDAQVFQALFDAYPDGVLVVDARGAIVLANPAVATLLGYSAAALQGQPVDMLVPAAVAPRHAAYRQGYALAPKARPMGTDLELQARHADGSEVMVEIALSPLRVGEVDYVVASVRGIGAYPRVKRAMQRAHYNEFVVQLGRAAVDTLDPNELLQRLPAVVAQALEVEAVGVALLSANQLELRRASYAGVPDERAGGIVYANRPDTALGYVVAQRVTVVATNLAREHRFEVPARWLEAGAQSSVAVPLYDRGRIIGVLDAWSRQPRRFGDDEVAFLESLASLLSTSLQRSQAEAQFRHAQRMETVGELTGGIAHDFNNLLTVILGNLQILADQDVVQTDALAQQLVAAATRAGQRGADLTGKLLAFSRRQALAPSVVHPVSALQSLADMLRRTLGDHIRVVLQLPGACAACLADAVQLESALLNVAINARDAMPGGGVLWLRCGAGPVPDLEALDIGDTRPAGLDPPGVGAVAGAAADRANPPRDGQRTWVWFSLKDNGSGMSAEVRDRAFEPFFTTKEAGRGTGLGLSTVYGFVKQSQGHVRIDSAAGAGTTVTLYLPALDDAGRREPDSRAPIDGAAAATNDATNDAINDATNAAANAAVDASVNDATTTPTATRLPPGLRVLLVEDDDDVRGVALSFLQALGCAVSACANAEAALVELQGDASFDLLFSDITLGAGIDGITLARQVSSLQPALAVLLTSGYSRYLGGAAADAATPPWEVLKKPFTPPALGLAIERAIQQARVSLLVAPRR